MKISRTKLRKLIIESVTGKKIHESAYDEKMGSIGTPEAGKINAPAQENSKAIIIHTEKVGKVSDIMKAISEKLKKPSILKSVYYIWRDLDEYWSNLGKPSFSMKDVVGRAGDPYMYQKVGDELRVVAGPKAKAIGVTFAPKSQEEYKPLGSLESSSKSSGSGSSGSSGSGSSGDSSGSSFSSL